MQLEGGIPALLANVTAGGAVKSSKKFVIFMLLKIICMLIKLIFEM